MNTMARFEGKRQSGNDRRQERAEQAAQHIADVDARLGKEVERSLAELKVYDTMPHPEIEGCIPTVAVIDEDSVAAVIEHGRGVANYCDLALLDFASFTSPGGGYDRGAWAQEEALCAESTLFNVLREQKAWYGENRRRNVNCEVYRNRGLVVPKVRFERGKYHGYADVIVVAAPNARRARENYRLDDETLLKFLRSRIRFVLGIADELGHEKLVLGAYGCGVFGWDAAVVARAFLDELATGKHAAKQVFFAVPSDRFNENLPIFEHVFANFPQVNDEPYVKLADRPKVEEKVIEEDDEDEDDWRKYL